jgi:hypothetical protein
MDATTNPSKRNRPRQLRPGTRVRITQQINARNGQWSTQTEGIVLDEGPEPTGSWFAHGRCDKLWLHRVRLQKDDGERTTVNLDQNSIVEVLAEPS